MASAFLFSFILDNMEEFQIHTQAVWTQKRNDLYMTNANLTVKKKKKQCRPGVHKYGAAVCGCVYMEFAACQSSNT